MARNSYRSIVKAMSYNVNDPSTKDKAAKQQPVIFMIPSPYDATFTEYLFTVVQTICAQSPERIARFQDITERVGETVDTNAIRSYLNYALADRIKGRQGVGYYIIGQEPVKVVLQPDEAWYGIVKQITDHAFKENPNVEVISPETLIYKYGVPVLNGTVNDLVAVSVTAGWILTACRTNDIMKRSYHAGHTYIKKGPKPENKVVKGEVGGMIKGK